MIKAERVVGRFLTAATVRLPDNAKDLAYYLLEACDPGHPRNIPSYWDVLDEMEKLYDGVDDLHDPCGRLFNWNDALRDGDEDIRADIERLEEKVTQIVKGLRRLR